MTDPIRFIVLIVFAAVAPVKADDADGPAAIHLTPAPVVTQELIDAVERADAALFEAAFNACKADDLVDMVADDLEFLHDKHGQVASSGQQFIDGVRDMCQGRREGRNFPARRELIPESVRVYPLNGYGAIQIGEHRFYAIVDGEPDRLTETGKFTHVWKNDGDTWRLSRVLSYDHVLAYSGDRP